MTPEKNQLADVRIEGYATDGAGIARIDGYVLFVPGAARGDLCRVRIVKALKSHGFGRIEAVVEPSPHRIESPCPVFPKCGGCDFHHLTYAEELDLKAARVGEAMTRIGGFTLDKPEIVPSPMIEGYRNKAQFPVCMSDGAMAFGFYRKRSHEIVPFSRCLIQDEASCSIARAVCRWADETGTLPWTPGGGGFLRHIYIRREGEKSLVCLVARGKRPREPETLVEYILQADRGVTGVVLNVNRREDNVILGDTYLPLWGESQLAVNVLGKDFALSPASFYQVNKPQAEAVYRQVLEYAASAASVLDLYCGIGTMTLALAAGCKTAVGVEIVSEAIRDAEENARRNGVKNVRFLCADAGEAAARLAGEGFRPDAVVCDPPRKGMDARGIEAVAAMNPEKIIYVACDPASLARDAKALAEKGWALTALKAFDLFPRTANIETVVLLSRKTPNDVIHVDLALDELDITAAEAKATYQEIKDYVLDKFGLKVSQLYIAQVKRKHGIIERENYNKPKSDNPKTPQCPPEKGAAILDALRHFKMV